MASELIVQTLKGPTSGANANKILLGSGQELYAPGHVIQVVQGSTNTNTYIIGTTTYTDTTLTASITPKSTNSKILVTINQCFYADRDSDGLAVKLRILRDSTTVYENDALFATVESGSIAQVKFGGLTTVSYLDSPSTTSAVTYKTQGAPTTTLNNAFVRFQSADQYSFITLMEIAG